ncbi:conserved hypothetical protein [Neospora caninum Liverpool]|uniref:Uncharacterized protein n=1 Tax=Neospora caninum (strain Liverpool) TaxID=572307 RepID=F0VNH8_NEOCL|nr:conserved hypothetical protein [Neospora caninum Liverpool]CBZ55274.1 conserved hypothetical protein [Neospora caninum Liverpool]CEL70004.1 TPA: hypothetical protein BN1204_056980 [Neospora caninum Liverpool]|eukprot:XP_003885302.1 conserved hypothetical protein [Neospora caninum Liverpool]
MPPPSSLRACVPQGRLSAAPFSVPAPLSLLSLSGANGTLHPAKVGYSAASAASLRRLRPSCSSRASSSRAPCAFSAGAPLHAESTSACSSLASSSFPSFSASHLPAPRACASPASVPRPSAAPGPCRSSRLPRSPSAVCTARLRAGFAHAADARGLLSARSAFPPSCLSRDLSSRLLSSAATPSAAALCETLHRSVRGGACQSAAALTEGLTRIKDTFPSQLGTHADPASLSASEKRTLSEAVYHFLMALNVSLPVSACLASSSFPAASLSPALDALWPLIDECHDLFLPGLSCPADMHPAPALLASLSGPAAVSLFLFFALASVLRRQRALGTDPASRHSPPSSGNPVGGEARLLSHFGAHLSLRERELTNESLLLLRIALEALGVRGKTSGLLAGVREGGRAGEEAAFDFFSLLPLHPHVTDRAVWGLPAGAEAADDPADEEEDEAELDEEEEPSEGASDQRSKGRSALGEKNRWLSPFEREVSSLLFRLEKPHDALPATLGAFSYTLRNAKKKELFICQHEKDFFTNEPDRPLAREQWRYLLAELRGWRLTFLARERSWNLFASQEAKEQLLRDALQKSS